MVDEHTDYRPARSRDFATAARDVDAADLQPATPPVAGSTLGEPPTYTPPNADYGSHGSATTAAPPVSSRETTTVTDRPVAHRPFSLAAGFFGWAVASFFTLVLATIVLAMLGASAYDASDAGTNDLSQETFNSLTTAGLIGLLVGLFIAYFLGGYAAGRIGLWHGTGHGLAVVGWSVLFSVLAIALGAYLGDAVAGLNLTPAVDWNALTGPTVVGLLITLAVMLAGAILGANLGTRTDTRDDVYEERRVGRYRGRPL